jgi:hypothetical protein
MKITQIIPIKTVEYAVKAVDDNRTLTVYNKTGAKHTLELEVRSRLRHHIDDSSNNM